MNRKPSRSSSFSRTTACVTPQGASASSSSSVTSSTGKTSTRQKSIYIPDARSASAIAGAKVVNEKGETTVEVSVPENWNGGATTEVDETDDSSSRQAHFQSLLLFTMPCRLKDKGQ